MLSNDEMIYIHYQISREKFEPEPGLKPQTSRYLAWRSTIELSWFNWRSEFRVPVQIQNFFLEI